METDCSVAGFYQFCANCLASREHQMVQEDIEFFSIALCNDFTV